MKIAFIADLHLSDIENTPQEEAFDWAVEELKSLSPDACVVLGDMTACGSLDAALRFRRKINALNFPCLTIPGNSDLRNASTASTLDKILLTHSGGLTVGGIHIVGIDTALDTISEAERERISNLTTGESIILCSHHPASYLDADSLEFLKNWIKSRQNNGQKVLLWANGHDHIYAEESFCGVPTVTLRALDLDKCIGGSAQIFVWNFDGEAVSYDSIDYARGLIDTWSEEERREFIDFLGITCYENTKAERDMPFAIQNNVRHLEWRKVAEGDLPLIEKWRKSGGKTLSLHFPNVDFDGEVIGIEKYKKYACDAIKMGADMVTIHPPQIANEKILLDTAMFDTIVDAVVEALLPVVEAKIDILVENNHTDHGTPNDPLKCAFGCTPFDIISWRDALNQRLGHDACHVRFDVGHARNNAPISQDYPIGKWYAVIGQEACAYHIHQTIIDSQTHKMKNHYPITGLHDGLVSFDGFLWAWHEGILNHAPIILEIREGEGAPATYERLKKIFIK